MFKKTSEKLKMIRVLLCVCFLVLACNSQKTILSISDIHLDPYFDQPGTNEKLFFFFLLRLLIALIGVDAACSVPHAPEQAGTPLLLPSFSRS
jgi:hypothetical protein